MTVNPFTRLTPGAACVIILAACTSTPAPESDVDAETQEAAYRQCLEDSMAVAMAWEAIEEMCRQRTEAEGDPLDLQPDPE